MCKVSSGQFSSLIKLSLSGYCYPSEPLLPHFDQSVSCPDWSKLCPSSSLFNGLRGAQDFLAQWLSAFSEQIFLGCSLPFLTSTQSSTQLNSMTSPNSIWVRVCHNPTLLPCTYFTCLPNFSGTVPASDHSPSWVTLPVCLPLCLNPPSNFKHPDLFWYGNGFLALGGKEAVMSLLLIWLFSQLLQQHWQIKLQVISGY